MFPGSETELFEEGKIIVAKVIAVSLEELILVGGEADVPQLCRVRDCQ